MNEKKDAEYPATNGKRGKKNGGENPPERRTRIKVRRSSFSFFEYVVLFVAVAAVATVSIFVSDAVSEASGSTALTAIVTAVVLIILSVALCAAGAAFRRASAEKPVKEILRATDKMARGDFNINLKPRHIWGKYDEYDVICENINSMAAELSKNEMLRSDFIANVSHEIKTPLSVISSYASLLGAKNLSGEDRAAYSAVLVSATRRLTSLVTDILKLNKLENQKIFPEKRLLDAGEVMRGCVLSLEEKIDEKDIALDCDIDDVQVVSDEGFLEIIFNNLISNAVKFTERGGSIGVLLRDEGEYVRACVRDSGCGMSAETGAHLFDKFYQGDTSHSQEGNGLGLALVKRVIDILGGEISVESRVGEGSSFTVRLKKR